MFDFGVVWHHLPSLLNGLWTTAWISLISIFIGFFFGALLCLGRMSHSSVVQILTKIYISAFRGTPLLVQLVIVFYFLPLAGINIPPILTAVIVLSMNTAAFQSEILRAGFLSLPPGQKEAAWTFGFSPAQRLIRIELPLVFRKTMPSLVNETIDIIKNSALISTIAVTDLMRLAQTYSSTSYRPIEFFLAAGALYLVLTSCISVLGRFIESKLATS